MCNRDFEERGVLIFDVEIPDEFDELRRSLRCFEHLPQRLLQLGIGFDLLGTETGQRLDDSGDAFGFERLGRLASEQEEGKTTTDESHGNVTNHFSPLSASSAMAASFSGPVMKSSERK